MSLLRDYQEKAVSSVFQEWQENDSTLVVAATGTGKTQIFCEVIRRNQTGRVLVLCHRNELVFQAVNRLKAFGLNVEIEKAGYYASRKAGLFGCVVIVSTIQTQTSRMTDFDPMDFSMVVIDEAHHATSPSWVKVINYYRQNPALKVLGVTATPDRADEMALGQVFKSVAFNYEILDAIRDGWLCPVKQQIVTIESLDFSAIRTTAGDLNGADLAVIMEAEKNLHGIASSAIEIIQDKRTIVFTVSVKQAEMLSEIFNRHRLGMSNWVCGATDPDERKERLYKFDQGETQVMVNVGVLTEGFDSPRTAVCIMARPTKSRSLYSQMVGRTTRPIPGIVDGLATPEERREAITLSLKPNCLIVDYVGNSGRHKLMTTADILGGKESEEVIDRAIERAKKEGQVDMVKIMEEEKEAMRKEAEARAAREAARRAHLIGKATFNVRSNDPFDILQIEPERSRGWDQGKKLSEKQTALLLKQGIDPSGMEYHKAKQLMNEMFRRWNSKLCTIKQAKLLQKHGYQTKNLPMAEASKLIDALAKNNWKRPSEPPTQQAA